MCFDSQFLPKLNAGAEGRVSVSFSGPEKGETIMSRDGNLKYYRQGKDFYLFIYLLILNLLSEADREVDVSSQSA